MAFLSGRAFLSPSVSCPRRAKGSCSFGVTPAFVDRTASLVGTLSNPSSYFERDGSPRRDDPFRRSFKPLLSSDPQGALYRSEPLPPHTRCRSLFTVQRRPFFFPPYILVKASANLGRETIPGCRSFSWVSVSVTDPLPRYLQSSSPQGAARLCPPGCEETLPCIPSIRSSIFRNLCAFRVISDAILIFFVPDGLFCW